MSKKYVIDLPDDAQYILINGASENHCYTRVEQVEDLEELNSDYINEHYGSMQDEAYQRGLEDAWEAAQKIMDMPDPPYWDVFCEYKNEVFKKLSASEAIAKLKAYEDDNHTDRIEVGDEVEDSNGDKTIVTNIHGNLFDGLCSDGSVMSDLFLDDNHKTGKHCDIQSILEAMRE